MGAYALKIASIVMAKKTGGVPDLTPPSNSDATFMMSCVLYLAKATPGALKTFGETVYKDYVWMGQQVWILNVAAGKSIIDWYGRVFGGSSGAGGGDKDFNAGSCESWIGRRACQSIQSKLQN